MLATYLARLALTTTGGLLRPRAGVLDDIRLPMTVWPSDLDTYGHVNNGRYLTLMDMGRLEWGLRTGIARALVRRKWAPVAGAATVRFRRELKAFWNFELSTRLVHWDDKWLTVEHRMWRGETLHANAYVRAVVREGRRFVTPAELLASVGHASPSPDPDEALALWIRSLQA